MRRETASVLDARPHRRGVTKKRRAVRTACFPLAKVRTWQ
jgi:hypothetical protein